MNQASNVPWTMIEQDRQISAIFAEQKSRLRNFIRRRVPDPRDAEDILQDAFYKLVEANRLLMPIDHVTSWTKTASSCRSKICCHRLTAGRKHSMSAMRFWAIWSLRSTNCPRSNAKYSSLTS